MKDAKDTKDAGKAAPPIEIKPLEAIDIESLPNGQFRVVVLTYHSGFYVPTVVLETSSGPEAAAEYMRLAKRKMFRAASGMAHPEGEQILPGRS